MLRSSSPESSSLWLKVGGQGFETKVVDGVLFVKSESNMVGYLNAESPFDDDGWMNTGDLVEVRDDGLVKFVGRKSDIINVGGQKVFPTEVEAVIMTDKNVTEAAVFGKSHPLLGQCVVANISLMEPEERQSVSARLRTHCRSKMEKYKVPTRFNIIDISDHATARAKKSRSSNSEI